MVELVLPKHRAPVRFRHPAQMFISPLLCKVKDGMIDFIEIIIKIMKNITIYSTPTCHYCNLAKDFLKEHGIKYTEYDVAADIEKRREMVDKSGQMGVPVIDVDGQIMVGFSEQALASAVGV